MSIKNGMINNAFTIEINHPKSSWAIFCFNLQGDMFVNSDWGFYGFAWRAYGKDFLSFLQNTNAQYIVQKFENNHREVSGKKMPAHRIENLTVLVNEFINVLRLNSNDNG